MFLGLSALPVDPVPAVMARSAGEQMHTFTEFPDQHDDEQNDDQEDVSHVVLVHNLDCFNFPYAVEDIICCKKPVTRFYSFIQNVCVKYRSYPNKSYLNPWSYGIGFYCVLICLGIMIPSCDIIMKCRVVHDFGPFFRRTGDF